MSDGKIRVTGPLAEWERDLANAAWQAKGRLRLELVRIGQPVDGAPRVRLAGDQVPQFSPTTGLRTVTVR